MTAQDCTQAASLQLLGQTPLALCSRLLLSSHLQPDLSGLLHPWGVWQCLAAPWVLPVSQMTKKPGASPLIHLPLALSSHARSGGSSPWATVAPGGLSGEGDTNIKFSCWLLASNHRYKMEWALGSIRLRQGGRR